MKYHSCYSSLALLISSSIYISFVEVKAECNGGASLCSKSYSVISQLITHDSYALTPNLAATQDYDIVDQLNDGVRGIKLSAVPFSADFFTIDSPPIHLCHTYCAILDAGLASTTLNNINDWLEANPKEVVTIMWNNLHNLKATQLSDVYSASNIMPMVYTHNQSNPWPTLQEMIDSGKRLVNFVDSQADPEQVPWLMDQFSQIFETPYDNTDLDAFNCTVDRIAQGSDPKDLMYVMNHFLYGVIELGPLKVEVPQREKAQGSNSAGSIVPHINQCINAFQKKPNFIEVDFYSIGDALPIIAQLNNVTFTPLQEKIDPLLRINNSSATIHSLSPTEHVLIDNSDGAGSKSMSLRAATINIPLSLLLALMAFLTSSHD